VHARASEIAAAVGGRVMGPDATTRRIAIDAREAGPGIAFVALPGTRTDGHRFVADAFARGAPAAIVDRVDVAASMRGTSILVRDPARALLELGRWWRSRLGATVVGVTGSVGKTTTKDLVASVAARRGSTVASPRSFNTELGVPVTICAADRETRTVVCEIGAGAPGEIAALCEVARPSIGIVTKVAPAHLETFGSMRAIALAKRELVEALPPEGCAIVNDDDAVVRRFAGARRPRVLRFGHGPGCDVRAEDERLDAAGRLAFTAVTGDARAPVRLRLLGRHQVTPALAALAGGLALAIPLEASADALASVRPPSRRLEERFTADGVRVLDDSYNANPVSMLAALETLAAAAEPARAVAVLGGMEQLGGRSPREHRAVGRAVAGLGIGRLVAVGGSARPIADAARAAGTPDVVWTPSVEAATDVVACLRGVDVVLVKASRAQGLDRLVEALCPPAMEPIPSTAGPYG
jgi:UDP-N-acetylmuramoyl-tripeptide--D-alanyl-D-alanine ligase